jgi:cellulose synthase/poly-beta-1,6-N-acetylglucosamine synthase-like glycosyltransferase/peptidoglycan/xylan/chitin deacetylase (PgdA/CDA1 family)/spore germination protein YaaH
MDKNKLSPEPPSAYPVFYDPRHVRGPVLKTATILLALVVLGLLASGAWSYFSKPSLPALTLPAPPTLRPGPGDTAASPPELPSGRLLEPGLTGDSREATATRPLAFGFLINWDEAGINSLQRHLNGLDVLIPQWLYFSTDDMMLIEDAPDQRQRIAAIISESGDKVRIMPLVANLHGGHWVGEAFATALARPETRSYMADQLVDYVEFNEFLGISVDFEQLPDPCLPDYYAFIEELALKLHRLERKLSVNVPFESETIDYARLAEAADYVIVMAYDEHWTGGEPGSIAGAPWLASRVAAFHAAVPPEKLVLGLGNYALDWSAGKPAAVNSVEGAWTKARQAGARVASDPVSLNPMFRYQEQNGTAHQVWILDAITAFNAAALFAPARPAAYAIWRLGLEDPAIWEFLGRHRPLNEDTARRLTRVVPQQVVYEGKGEILRLSSKPEVGLRRLWFGPEDGLIHAESFDVLPASYVNTRYGGEGRFIALTFDDGPDPAYTPAILSILRDCGVKATFFVVGLNGQLHPELLQREAAEGHEIGIHTFSHPDIARITPATLAREIEASQGSLEMLLGCHSILFRPPYGRDINTANPDLLKPVEQISDMGYLTVGMRLDTEDWTNPGVDEMVDSVIEQAREGGQIMVMHDSGGNRQETLEALPQIIQKLREQGFEFVTVSGLLGLERHQVNPPLAPLNLARAKSNKLSLGILGASLRFIKWIFISGLILGILRMVLIGLGALAQRRRARRWAQAHLPDLSVSVIIPAHNESKVVIATVQSLLNSEGVGPFDILVVDDGSTDDTYRCAAEAFATEPRVRVFTKPNGGKSTALNHGLLRTQSDIVIMLDADTLFRPDAVRRLLAHFSDPKVGAVAGNVKVGNRVNLLTRWQALEYITSQSLDRRALTVINCNNVVPGAIGAWRRDLVMRAGMLNHRTLAEDGDLTMAICRMGFQVDYDDSAIALTEAPDTLNGFLRQRFRWMFGTFQVSAKHFPALFNRNHPWLGFVGMPNLLLFQVFFPLLAPFMDLVVMSSAVTLGYTHFRNIQMNTIGLWQFVLYYLLFLTVDTLSASLAFVLEKKEDFRLLAWVPVQRVFYRMMMYVVATRSICAALSGRAVGWGAIQRKATVAIEENRDDPDLAGPVPVPADPRLDTVVGVDVLRRVKGLSAYGTPWPGKNQPPVKTEKQPQPMSAKNEPASKG